MPPPMQAYNNLDTTVHNPESTFGHVKSGNWEVKMEDITWGAKIGEGAMAAIFKAKLKGRECVAKRLKQGVDSKTQAYKDLIMELEILTSVGQHPNLVEFYGACIADSGSPIILEELVKGPNLEKFMVEKYIKLERCTIYAWTLDIVRALDFLHNRNPIIIHRDLKPANLMLTQDYSQIKLADFGMSKKVDASQRDQAAHKGRTGTVRYMAPEVISQHTGNYTEKADMYSAALIVWYIATGIRPQINDKHDLMARPDIKAVEWQQLGTLIGQMWNHNANQRPSAGDCIRILATMEGRPDLSQSWIPKNVKGGCCSIQ